MALNLVEAESDQVSLKELARRLLAAKRLILASVLIGGVIAGGVSLAMVDKYTAAALLMPPAQQRGSLAMLGQIGLLPGLAASDLGFRNPTEVYVGLLSSQSATDGIITRFQLKDALGAKTMTAARKRLRSRTSIEAQRNGLIHIRYTDTDPKRAADIANAYIDELSAINNRLAMTEASQRRMFFEKELSQAKLALANAEGQMRKTQERRGIYQISGQAEAAIRATAQLRAEITAREAALNSLKTGATDQNPMVIKHEAQLSALRERLQQLLASQPGGETDALIPTGRLPAAGLEYVRAFREVKYQETLMELLARQFEIARVDESRQANVVQVVDRASVPDQKSGPVRRLYALAGGCGFGILSCLWVLFRRSV